MAVLRAADNYDELVNLPQDILHSLQVSLVKGLEPSYEKSALRHNAYTEALCYRVGGFNCLQLLCVFVQLAHRTALPHSF